MPDHVPAGGGHGIAFTTLGCKVNRAESDHLAARLLGMGASIVAEEDAAVVVINTCTVTGEADRKARKVVRRALGLPGSPVVVVTGCLAALDAAALEALGGRVVVEADKDVIAERVAGLLGMEAGERVGGLGPRTGVGFRTRVAVKVEDGCDAFCAYCIVPHARGLPRSVPLAGVVAEVEGLVEAGVAEVVLTGINIGRYRDEEACAGLAHVVSAVSATGVRRMRLSSVEPNDLTPQLLEALARSEATCAHLHVPLQSGSDAVLQAMGRPYTMAGFAERIAAAREALPGLVVTTDVIAGFPGETDEDALATFDAVDACGFSRLHVFRFSARAGTPAATMPGRVPAPVVASRAAALRELDVRLRARYAAGRVGDVAEVLVESVSAEADGSLRASGTTRDYLTLSADGTGRAPGYLGYARVLSADGGTLCGEWL